MQLLSYVGSARDHNEMRVLSHVPIQAKELLTNHLLAFSGELIISKPRKSKLGDFKTDVRTMSSRISINDDLNQYAFLVTLLHELAHFHTWKKWGHLKKPHGMEWKSEFQNLLIPYLEHSVFPENVASALTHYIKNPKASSCSDVTLYRTLEIYNKNRTDLNYISEVSIGGSFIYGKRGEFSVLGKKRTRFLCLHLESKRKYLFQPITKVKIITSA